eukprot:scaffold79329_cov21-Prasinocladus_malaysianus.AAC.1
MDKTGTLTEGHFRVKEVVTSRGCASEQELLFWAGSVEAQATHPLSPAVVAYAVAQGVAISQEVRDLQTVEGKGVTARVDGRMVFVGNQGMAEAFCQQSDLTQ